jgi:hypothetical protein
MTRKVRFVGASIGQYAADEALESAFRQLEGRKW